MEKQKKEGYIIAHLTLWLPTFTVKNEIRMGPLALFTLYDDSKRITVWMSPHSRILFQSWKN